MTVKPSHGLAGTSVHIEVTCKSGKMGKSTDVASKAFGQVKVHRRTTSGAFRGTATVKQVLPRQYRVAAVCGLRPRYATGTFIVVAKSKPSNTPPGAVTAEDGQALYLPARRRLPHDDGHPRLLRPPHGELPR